MEKKPLAVPLSDYKILYSLKGFCMILNPEMAKEITLDTNLKVRVLRDQDYFKENSDNPVCDVFYDIGYIRDTRLKGVIKPEWDRMYGPQSLKSFLRLFPEKTIDDPVRIIFLDPINYDLKDLKKNYRNPSKYGR